MQVISDVNQIKSNITPNAIVCSDCMDVFPLIADKSIDMVLCDPPFAVTQAEWDKELPWSDIWIHLKRIVKPNAAVVLMATQPFAADLINSNREWFRYDIIWAKNKSTGHLNAKKMPMRSHESILVFYESLPQYNPQMSSGHDPLHYAVNRKDTTLYGHQIPQESRTGATDRYPSSVVEFDVVNNQDRIHPTQKPVSLFEYLIKTYTNEGAAVLDFCAGCLTTAFAANNTNRQYICVEKEQKYVDVGIEKLNTIL